MATSGGMRRPNTPRTVRPSRNSVSPPRDGGKTRSLASGDRLAQRCCGDRENLADLLVKGKQVYIEGRLQTRSYEKNGQKHYSTEVTAEEVILLGGGNGERTNGGKSGEADPPYNSGPAAAPSDDDVPF